MPNTDLMSGLQPLNAFEMCNTTQLRDLLAFACETDDASPTVSLVSFACDRPALIRTVDHLFGRSADSNEDALTRIASAPLDELQRMKAIGRSLNESESSSSHQAVAVIVYHAAIAAALANHGATITSVDNPERIALYVDLATALAPSPMSDVFRRAADLL